MIDPTVAHRLLQHPQIAELLVRAFGAKVQFVEEDFAGIHRVKNLAICDPVAKILNLGNIETEEIINPPKQLPSPQR
eukprot:CAMPEP_0177726944 /NCGR_PEP_ID=MMETSP0484_2-20121128/20051_1 /TAXON_ID=354590 /ORGANISM="Rhodomonas lens, Strain RHODO" /LENGTH=76 /DNA_ID=CAMNT_0019239551 /DNA_START=180 /DNA_END=407 /DNA_ORIENTATION=-